MSSPLAIGAVSAVLRNLLDNGLVDVGAPLGSVEVTAVAPDTIKLDDPNAPPSLNLFLYRTSPNQGWREVGPAGVRRQRRAAARNPPLALNLHYLLTAYGSADFQAEILLGYAMHLLHERPVLDRAAIRTRARPEPARPVDPAAGVPGADRVRPRRPARGGHGHPRADGHRGDVAAVVGDPGALPADRGYLVSVVLIEARKPTRTPLPVLSRGRSTRSPAASAASSSSPACCRRTRRSSASSRPTAQPAARSGETVPLAGHHLDGTAVDGRVRAPPARRAERASPIGASADPTGSTSTLPSGAPPPSRPGRPASTR